MSEDVVVWRIASDTPDYEADDLTGAGAKASGGRWNRAGIAVIYASATRALACLETLVHLNRDAALPLNRFLVRIAIPEAHWRSRAVLDPARHVGWDAEPEGKVSIEWGTSWVRSASTLVAEVPSVIVPEESNVLINPGHTDVGMVRADKVRRWLYDVRL